MSVRINGKAIALSSDVYNFTQGQGWTRRIEWRGYRKQDLQSHQAVYAAAGFNCTLDRQGVVWVLIASSGGVQDGSSEVPIDSWSWRKEIVQKPIWTLPSVANAIKSSSKPAGWKKDIEDLVNDGKSWSQLATTSVVRANPTSLAIGEMVYNELSQGTDSYETETAILQRQRATTPRYAERFSLTSSSFIYTTSQLIAAEGIPSEVALVLPSDPAITPPQSKWGWRNRDHDGGKDTPIRFQENSVWVFAAWSTFLYSSYSP